MFQKEPWLFLSLRENGLNKYLFYRYKPFSNEFMAFVSLAIQVWKACGLSWVLLLFPSQPTDETETAYQQSPNFSSPPL